MESRDDPVSDFYIGLEQDPGYAYLDFFLPKSAKNFEFCWWFAAV
jgi:hypothetical protein